VRGAFAYGSAHRSAASRREPAILRYTGALAPMAKLVDATDLKQLSGSRGNALPDPVKVGEPPGISRGNAEPIRTVQSGRQV